MNDPNDLDEMAARSLGEEWFLAITVGTLIVSGIVGTIWWLCT